MKKGAIFDMDGTLLNTERFFAEGWVCTAEKFGQRTLPFLGTKMSGASPPDCRKILASYYPDVDTMAYSEAVYDYVRKRREEELAVMAGVRELLVYLEEEKIPMAVASSSDHADIEENLERAGIRRYFQSIVGGDEVEKGKPDPEIFRRAAEGMGLASEECYIFEDSFNGIRAAHAAGGAAIMVPDQVEPDEEIRGLCRVYEDCHRVLEDIRAGKI